MDTPPDWDKHLSAQRNRAWKGRAKVDIRWLDYNDYRHYGTQSLDPKNIARLVKIFELEGCFRREPEHYVPALISPEALEAALRQANRDQGELFLVREEPLHLGLSGPLICLHGRHRLEAAKQHLNPEDKWWVVDLYLDDIDEDAKAAITEEYSNSRNFSDGDIFRNLRYHQINDNNQGAGKWMARLSESKRRDVIQLQKMALQNPAMAALSEAFDDLLPYIGLWSALQLGTFHRLLTLRCPQELTHYLRLIEKTWDFILGSGRIPKPCVDANTVQLLQTRCLLFSSEDHVAVTADMDNGVLFPNVPSPRARNGIKVRLERIKYMIPSLRTFLEDTKYLEPCAKIVKSLLPVKFKGTIREAYAKSHTGRSQWQEQLNEHTVSERSSMTVKECIWFAYRQIWLFAMRHFPDMIGICPRKDDGKPKPAVHRPDENLWHKIAELAVDCGFQTPAIAEYTRRSPLQKMASEFLRQCRPPEYYDVNTAALNTAVDLIVRTLQDIQPRVIRLKAAQLTSDYRDNIDLADRCGRPFEQSFLDDKKYMFLQHIYNNRSHEWTSDQREHYLTSFKVKQDIFIAFFGYPDEETEEHSAEDRAMENANRVDVENVDRSPGLSQALGGMGSTGAPLHSSNNSESTNVPAARTGLFQPLREPQAPQDISHDDTSHAEEAMGNNGQSRESTVIEEGTAPGTGLSQDISHDDTSHAEEAMGNNGQSRELTVIEEDTAPGTGLSITSSSDIQEELVLNYPAKRRRTNGEEYEVISPLRHLTTMNQTGTPQQQAATSTDSRLTAFMGFEFNMSQPWEEPSSSSRPATMIQTGTSQQQTVTSTDSPVVGISDEHTPGTPKWNEYLTEDILSSGGPATMIQTGNSQQQAVTSTASPEVGTAGPSHWNKSFAAFMESEKHSMLPAFEEPSPSSHPVTMNQSTSSQQQTVPSYPETIPVGQATSDYVRRHFFSRLGGPPGRFITCVAADTGQLTYIRNDYESYRKWYITVHVQCLAVDPTEKIHNQHPKTAFDNTTKSMSPMVLYEPRSHRASLQDRTLGDLDSPYYSRRGELS